MNAPDVYRGYTRLVPHGKALINEVAARFGLKVFTYRPGRLAAKVPCPILFCVCQTDSVAPAAATCRHAAKAPHGEVKLYPVGHFDIYVGDAFERVVTDQLEFLEESPLIVLERRLVAPRSDSSARQVDTRLGVHAQRAFHPNRLIADQSAQQGGAEFSGDLLGAAAAAWP